MRKKTTIILQLCDIDCICSLLGITQKELARRIGYSETHISKSRKSEIPLKLSRRVTEHFGLDDDFIIRLRELQALFDSITKGDTHNEQ